MSEIKAQALSPEQRERTSRLVQTLRQMPSNQKVYSDVYVNDVAALLSHIAYLEEENKRLQAALDLKTFQLDDTLKYVGEQLRTLHNKLDTIGVPRVAGQTHQEGIEK